MRRICDCIFVTIACLSYFFGSSLATAQDSSYEGYRIHAGFGVSTCGLALGVGGSYEYNDDLLSARYLYSEEFDLFTPLPIQSIWEVAVLYGRTKRSTTSFFAFAGGVSLVGSTKRGQYLRNTNEWFPREVYESVNRTMVGFPIEVQALWTPSSFVAVGIYVFGNLNTHGSFGGALLSFQMGKWRRE